MEEDRARLASYVFSMDKRDGHIDKEERRRDTTGEIERETRRKPDDETTTNAHVQEEEVDSLQGQDV